MNSLVIRCLILFLSNPRRNLFPASANYFVSAIILLVACFSTSPIYSSTDAINSSEFSRLVDCDLDVDIEDREQVCNLETSANFTAVVTGGTGPFNYDWEISGDAEIQSGQNEAVVVVYNITGHFSLEVNVTDAEECQASDEEEIIYCVLTIGCPQDESVSCYEESHFQNWLAAFTADASAPGPQICNLGTIMYQAFYDGSSTPSVMEIITEGQSHFTVDVDPPNVCGGSVLIVLSATTETETCIDVCGATYVIEQNPPVAVCPPSQVEDADQSQSDIDDAFEAWKDEFTSLGGCGDTELMFMVNGEVVDPANVSAPDACGGEITMKLIAKSECGEDMCESTFTVIASGTGLILALPGQLQDCFPTEPTFEDVPPPRSDEEIIEVFLITSACVDPSEITVEDELFGPFVDGNERTFIRLYKVTAGQLSTEAEEKFTFEVDLDPPVFVNFPDDVTVPCEGSLPPWPLVRAFDEGIELTVTRIQVPGFASCGGAFYERRFSTVDLCGNLFTRKQTIRLSDDEPPSLTVPPDTTIYCGQTVPGPYYEVEDNCSAWEVSFDEARTDFNACEYKLIRTWTARDGCGNKTTKSQTIHVVDDEAPEIQVANPMLVGISNGASIEVFNCDRPQALMSDVSVSDCCTKVTVEAFDDLVASNVCDVFGYYRKWKCGYIATDDAGNVSQFTFFVLQYDNEGGELLNVPPDVELECEEAIPPPAENVAVRDNCSRGGEPQFSETLLVDPDNVQRVGIIRTWSYVDDCGNRSEATQRISRCDFDFSIASAEIGNLVWLDGNGNGVMEDFEGGLDNVKVYLYHVDLNNDFRERIIDSTLTHTVNGIQGSYLFANLLPSAYRIRFEAPDSLQFTDYQVGENPDLDSDIDPATGMTDVIMVDAGQLYYNINAGLTQKQIPQNTTLKLFVGNS
ncbi:MAG: hypothetical protein OEM26_00960, partial [Saprospiraceae bacterium]|nr:hypothetical protein [Saprospiraceae bacterium]